MKVCGIYSITNIIDSKMYIGYSINIKKRFYTHKSFLINNTHGNIHLQAAYNKYGKDNFLFEVLELCEEQFLCSQEHYWAILLNVHNDKYGYNLKQTHPHEKNQRNPKESYIKGGLKTRGRKASKETCERISNSNKGKIFSEETRKKISDSKKGKIGTRLGKRHRQSTIELMKKVAKGRDMTKAIEASIKKRKAVPGSRKGKSLSLEQKKKLSDSLKIFYSKFGEVPRKSIVKLDIFGKILERYTSSKKAALSNNIDRRGILLACKRKEIYKGMIWRFEK